MNSLVCTGSLLCGLKDKLVRRDETRVRVRQRGREAPSSCNGDCIDEYHTVH